MFKVMILLKRNPDISFDDFQLHWRNNHALLVRQLPDIKKAVFNFTQDDGESEVDAVSELWFFSNLTQTTPEVHPLFQQNIIITDAEYKLKRV